MFEALHTRPPRTQPRVLAKFVTGIDYLVPFLDIGVIFFWVPGVILFLFGYPLIFGWWSMLLLPITLIVFAFCAAGRNSTFSAASTFIPRLTDEGSSATSLVYQVLSSFASLRGYGQYILGSGRRWK